MNFADIFYHWERVRKGLVQVIDRFDVEDLAFAPFEGAWTAHETLLHIAGTEQGWFRHTVLGEAAWPEDPETGAYPDAAAIKDLLAGIHAQTLDYLRKTPLEDFDRELTLPWGPVVPLNWIFWHILEHEIHHRGELSLLLGMLGKEGLDV